MAAGDADGVTLREVLPGDLPIFFRNQQDPAASELAAFPVRSWDDFLRLRKQQLLGDRTTLESTVLAADGGVAGHILSWQQDGQRFLGYWLGREHWGKGIATAALRLFLQVDQHRPLHAHVALHNVASQRVLEKCGLRRVGGPERAADGVQEYLYRMDGPRALDRAAYVEGLLAAVPASLWRWLPHTELSSRVRAELDEVLERRMYCLENAERYAQRCPVVGAKPADYQLRELEVCGGAARVLAGIHFKHLRLDRPFVGVYAQTRLLSATETLRASRELGAAFAAFRPLHVSWWSPEQHDLRAVAGVVGDQRLIAAPLRELGQRQELPAGLRLRRDPSGDSFAAYAAMFEEFWLEHPGWREELQLTDEDEYRECAREGCLMQVEQDGQIAGVLAARLGALRGLHGWEMLDELLGRSLRGRGLAPTLQRHFASHLDADRAPLLWGTIASRNERSWRTALRVGRRDLGGWLFFPL
jgi:RimJ/RimL family protein N-acetyltransferase